MRMQGGMFRIRENSIAVSASRVLPLVNDTESEVKGESSHMALRNV